MTDDAPPAGDDAGREGDDGEYGDDDAEHGSADPPDDRLVVGFVCVQNAGRSQMATAFAERELAERGLGDRVRLVTGGTDPAAHVHDVVVDVMNEVGFDLADRTPREVSFEEIQACDYVVTMGCAAEDVCPASWAGENRDWGLDDPDDATRADAARIRDEIADRVDALFDELVANRDRWRLTRPLSVPVLGDVECVPDERLDAAPEAFGRGLVADAEDSAEVDGGDGARHPEVPGLDGGDERVQLGGGQAEVRVGLPVGHRVHAPDVDVVVGVGGCALEVREPTARREPEREPPAAVPCRRRQHLPAGLGDGGEDAVDCVSRPHDRVQVAAVAVVVALDSRNAGDRGVRRERFLEHLGFVFAPNATVREDAVVQRHHLLQFDGGPAWGSECTTDGESATVDRDFRDDTHYHTYATVRDTYSP